MQILFIPDINNHELIYNLNEYFSLELIQLDFCIFLFYNYYLLEYFLVVDFHLRYFYLQYILRYQKFILYILLSILLFNN